MTRHFLQILQVKISSRIFSYTEIHISIFYRLNGIPNNIYETSNISLQGNVVTFKRGDVFERYENGILVSKMYGNFPHYFQTYEEYLMHKLTG